MRFNFVVPFDQKVAHKSHNYVGTLFISLSLPKIELWGLAWPYPLTRKFGILMAEHKYPLYTEIYRFIFNLATLIISFLVWQIQREHWKDNKVNVHSSNQIEDWVLSPMGQFGEEKVNTSHIHILWIWSLAFYFLCEDFNGNTEKELVIA